MTHLLIKHVPPTTVSINQRGVMMIPHLIIFDHPREHDNAGGISVVHHLPEVSAGGIHGTLSDDVLVFTAVALQ